MNRLQLVLPFFGKVQVFHFLLNSLCDPPERQNPLDCKFLLINSGSDLFTRKSDHLYLKIPENVSFFRASTGLLIYHLVVCSNFDLLHNPQCIIFPTQSCLVLVV